MFWHGMVPHVEKVLYYSQFDPNGMKGVVFVHRGDQLFFENFWHLPIWPCFYLDTIKASMPMVENGLKRPIQVRDNDGHFNNRNVYTNNTIHIKGAGHSQLVIVRFLSIIKVKRYLTGSNNKLSLFQPIQASTTYLCFSRSARTRCVPEVPNVNRSKYLYHSYSYGYSKKCNYLEPRLLLQDHIHMYKNC